MKNKLINICNGKALQRKVAKAISQALQNRGEYYITLHSDKGYADPIRVWAEIRFVWNYTDHKVQIKVRKMNDNIKYPFKTLGSDEADIATINKLTKWACAFIEQVR